MKGVGLGQINVHSETVLDEEQHVEVLVEPPRWAQFDDEIEVAGIRRRVARDRPEDAQALHAKHLKLRHDLLQLPDCFLALHALILRRWQNIRNRAILERGTRRTCDATCTSYQFASAMESFRSPDWMRSATPARS